MAEGRNTTCTLIIGAQRTGKTTFAKRIADEYPKKVLVVCPDDMEPAWLKYKLIQPEEIRALTGGKSRVIYNPRDKFFLQTVTDNFRNGLIIWDDAKVYFNNNQRIFELETFLVRRRQYNIDAMMMYHGFSTIAPLLWTYATHTALFRTNDAFERAKDKILNYDQMLKHMEDIKQEAVSNPHYHRIITLQ